MVNQHIGNHGLGIFQGWVKSFEDLDLKDLNPFYKGFERI